MPARRRPARAARSVRPSEPERSAGSGVAQRAGSGGIPALFDSHCHLTDERFRGDVADVIDRARACGVVGMVTIASDAADAEAAIALARRFPDVWATAGLHPHTADRSEDLDRIDALVDEDRVVAIGETGLDYHYENASRAAQRCTFDAHVALAERTGLPLVVHSRDADADTIDVVRACGVAGIRGVLHCFAGGPPLLEAALEAGWHVSFSGLASFGSYDAAGYVGVVPADRLLIETDSPYLAPVPVRGKRNEPAFVRHVAAAVAAAVGASADELAHSTTANARRFYRLDGA
ncbi:MAG: TatD family hydrolase [Longimicrobiales bacterium]